LVIEYWDLFDYCFLVIGYLKLGELEIYLQFIPIL